MQVRDDGCFHTSRAKSLQLYLTLHPHGFVALQAPLSMGFSKQEYWSALPCPPPGDLPNTGIEPVAPAALVLQADSLQLSYLGSPVSTYQSITTLNDFKCQ